MADAQQDHDSIPPTRTGISAKGRDALFPIERLFLERHSSRAFSGEPVSPSDMALLLEAARWAPSAFNEQPWRFLVLFNGAPGWDTWLSWLSNTNRSWCVRAGALVLAASKRTMGPEDWPSKTHSFDTGAAWACLALQAASAGLIAHGMAGFDYERAAHDAHVPEGFRVECLIAVGWPGRREDLPEKLQVRETPSQRKPVHEIAFLEAWGRPFETPVSAASRG